MVKTYLDTRSLKFTLIKYSYITLWTSSKRIFVAVVWLISYLWSFFSLISYCCTSIIKYYFILSFSHTYSIQLNQKIRFDILICEIANTRHYLNILSISHLQWVIHLKLSVEGTATSGSDNSSKRKCLPFSG